MTVKVPPETTTFDPINWHASLGRPHSNLTLLTANLHTSDLAHVASIVQGLIATIQPPASRAGGVAPSTPASGKTYFTNDDKFDNTLSEIINKCNKCQ